mgnify:FL=1|jgi:hypothetical protein
MTEQNKKAKELIDKYMSPIDGLHKYPMCFDTAKQCAILCVDEILKIAVDISDDITWTKGFWHQVKQEIINYKN